MIWPRGFDDFTFSPKANGFCLLCFNSQLAQLLVRRLRPIILSFGRITCDNYMHSRSDAIHGWKPSTPSQRDQKCHYDCALNERIGGAVRFPDRHGPGINESCTMKKRNCRGAVVHPKMSPITNEQLADSPQRTSWPGSSQRFAELSLLIRWSRRFLIIPRRRTPATVFFFIIPDRVFQPCIKADGWSPQQQLFGEIDVGLASLRVVVRKESVFNQ